MLEAELGRVVRLRAERPGAQELEVEVGGERASAMNFPCLTGAVAEGESVLLNTTAVRLGLGSGGYHFVMARKRAGEGPRSPEPAGREAGHIMKLRYTPLQFRCQTVEEAPAHREKLEACPGLEGLPVVVLPLHSLLAPVAAGLKARRGEGATIVYVMTDSAALPLPVSRLVAEMREAGLLAATITTGQAFGGDYEAVNLFSGLLAAKAVAGAEVIIVGQGPGNVGTETEWGFSGIHQGEIINAVGVLGGRAVAVPRISFADPRPRHRGLSRQSQVALGQVALHPAVIALPRMREERREAIWRQLLDSGIADRHEVAEEDGEFALEALAARGLTVTSMGRTVAQDREFFLAGGAAAAIASKGEK